MRILVLGVYYARNLGDAVICDCVAAQLRAQFPGAEIVVKDVRARTCFAPEGEADLSAMERRRLRAKMRRIATKLRLADKEYDHHAYRLGQDAAYIDELCKLHFDLAVFAGGQLFQDGFALHIARFVRHFEESGTPVFFNACGVGAQISPKIRRALTEALKSPCVRLISTRDDAAGIEKRYGVRAIRVSDPGLFAAETYGVEKQPADTVGLGIMYATSVNMRRQARFWAGLIRELDARQIPWKLFVNGSMQDMAYAKHLYSRLRAPARPFADCFAALPQKPEELVRCIAGFRSLISFRLHSHVIAASLGIPSVAVVWDEKVRFFFRALGHPERCVCVRTGAKKVLARLTAAENEGCPSVENQKINAMAVLLTAMDRVIKERL